MSAPPAAGALHDAGQIIFKTRDFRELPEAIVRVSMTVMSADAVTLLLPGIDGKFYVAHAFGLAPEVARSTRVTVGEGVAGRVAASRRPVVISGDASQHEAMRGVTARTRVRSSIVYPLALGDEVLGILTFNRLTDERPFNAEELDRASVLASQVLLALENARLARQTATAEKLASVGQLAAGIAHEINTPVQFAADSLHFLTEAFEDLLRLVDRCKDVVDAAGSGEGSGDLRALAESARQAFDEADLPYLQDAVPGALARTADGISRVANIVRAVKELGRPGGTVKVATDVNASVRATLDGVHRDHAEVADVEADLADVPRVLCHPAELEEVLRNLVVNAAQAIGDGASGGAARGKITARTRREESFVLVAVEDTGPGIAPEIQGRVFDPFFTTRAVGHGTGLGLSIARAIVEKHGGSLTFDTEVGRGTRFSLRLPVDRAST